MKNITRKQWIKFGIALTLYIIWVVWLKNYWWLLGVPVLVDMYLTKKINWAFWKKRNKKNNTIVEWLDALIFALVAVTFINIFFFQNFNIPTPSMEKSLLIGDNLFVSKVHYGPRIPQTPLSFPLVQHTLPLTKDKNSFLTWIKKDYRRLGGLQKIKNNDVVVFNYPEGDTVSTKWQSNISYYGLVREVGREVVWKDKARFGRIVTRPVDKRENFIKRCVGIHGDSIQVINNQVFVNGKPQEKVENLQFSYSVQTNGTKINQIKMDNLGIAHADVHFNAGTNTYTNLPLTTYMVSEIEKLPNVLSVIANVFLTNSWENGTFPFSENFKWNRDNYGPIWIPEKGVTIDINTNNLPLYERLIDVYEDNDLKVKNGKIYINDEVADTYTFKMDYFWMMGDNRHNSADSRYWGFVPEDHVVGKPLFVYISFDKEGKFPFNIRWKRMMTKIR
jgi:signal peptidase I